MNTLTDLPGSRFWKAGAAAFGVAGLLGSAFYLGSVLHLITPNALPSATSSQGLEGDTHPGKHRQQEAQKERKALLVQKINRYWELRQEAVERGIDVSRVPLMPFVVGDDGNIYRIMPNGCYQLVPDDQFNNAAPAGV